VGLAGANGTVAITASCAPAPASAPTISAAWNLSTANVGQVRQIQITITNPGSTTLTDVSVAAAALPANLVGASPGTTCTSSTATYNGGTRALSMSGGTLAAGASCTLSLSATATAAGSYTYTTGVVSAAGGLTGTTATTGTLVATASPTVTQVSPSSGPISGLQTVVITGTNFTGVTGSAGVQFGGVNAEGYTVTSDTQIVATSPAHASGVVDVTVTNGANTSATGAASQYSYVTAPVSGSQTYGSIISYNTGANQTTTIPVNLFITGGDTPTSYSVGSATTAQGGSVSINSSGEATYTPPVGYRNANDSFVYRATNAGGTSNPATVTLTIGNPTITGTLPVTSAYRDATFNPSATAITFEGGRATYTVNIILGLPSGLNYSGGVISGTPNVTGSFNITANVSDSSLGAGPYNANVNLGTLTITAPRPTVTGVSPNAGPTSGGQNVVITGTGFTGTTGAGGVKFGGTNATIYTVNSNTQIIAMSPANSAGTYDITVTNPGGTSATSAADQYTYVAPPVSSSQTYGSIIGYNTGADATTNIDLSLYVSGGGMPTSYAVGSATTAQGGTVSVNSSGIATYTPPRGYRNANDSFTWTGSNAGGTSSPATVTVTVGNPTITLALPSATATVERVYNAGGAAVTVNGGRPTYTVNSISGLPSGLTDAGGGVITGTPDANGVFTVSVNVTDSSLGAGPYTANLTANLTVGLPPAPVASSFSISGLTYNSGSATATTFSAASHVSESPTGYQVGASSYGATVSVDSAGLMSYTPPVGFRGTDTFNWVGTNAGGTSNVGQVFVTVDDPILSGSLPSSTGTVGVAYNSGASVVTVTGGNAPYNNFQATGLPAGLTMDSSGVISGVPTTATNATVVITVTDSSGGNGSYTSTFSAPLNIAGPTITLSPGAGALPGALAGAAYSQTITASGGVGPLTLGVTAGSLPPGLTLDNGVISGAPTATGTYNFTITATDSSGNAYTGAAAYSIAVSAPAIDFSPPSLTNATVGQAYSQTVTTSGGTAPYTFSLDSGALPAGLDLSTAGAITGTPTQGGSFPITIRATDSTSGGTYSATQSYTLTVMSPSIALGAGPLAGGTVGVAYSETLSASGGTAGYSYQVTAGSLPPGLTVSTGGVISGTSTGGGTYNFTVTATDSSTGTGPYTGSSAYSIVMGAPAIIVGPPSISNAQIGVAYSQTMTTSGGTAGYTYGLIGALPAGLSLNPITGAITGVPTQAGSFSFDITSTDSSTGLGAPFTGSRTYVMSVISPSLTLTPSGLSGMVVGSPFTATITAGGGTAPWNYFMYGGTILPPGLSLTSDGQITGTPTAGGAFSFTIAATDSSTGTGAPFTVARGYTVTVGAPTVVINTTSLPDGQMGSTYSQTVTTNGGTAPYSHQVTAGALPNGLTLAGDGTISGTPTSHGTFNFTITATDASTGAGPYTASQAYALVIGVPNPPVVGAVSLDVGYNASATPVPLSLSGGTALSVAVGTPPSHGTATVSGLGITYTPATGYFGADSFTYTATNDGGMSTPATVSITVGVPPAPTVSAVSGGTAPYGGAPYAITLSPSGVYDSLSVATAPAHGMVTITGTTATYTPNATHFGADSFTYTATGPGGTSAPATVSLTVATPPPPVVDTPPGPVVVPTTPGSQPGQPVVINLEELINGVFDGFRITVTSQYGSAEVNRQSAQAQRAGPSGPQAAPGDYQLVYTPAPNFMGTDTVTLVAYGPGGDSTPVTFTFQVSGKAPDLSGAAASNASVTLNPTTGLIGGPFQALRITRAPAFGTATVNGLSIVFTPGVTNGGSTSLDYVIDLPFGASAAGRIDLVSNLVPGQQALTATTVQGRPVTTRISNTQGGPFTGAAVVSISPTTAGTATITGTGGVYDLTFTPNGTFSGAATVNFTLTNATGTTASTLVVTVEARPDPAQDAEVRGVASSQVSSARRFADAQINNFQRRLQDLHDGDNRSSNGVSLNLGFGAQSDADNDPRAALRRQLTGGRETVDPDTIGVDREREMLGLDIWAGRPTAMDAVGSGVDRLSAVPASSGTERRSTLGFWTAGSVDWGRQDAQGARDYRFTTQGVTAGLDMRLNDQLIIGAGLGYGEDKTKIGDNGSVSNGSGLTGALYASWRPAESFYIDGVVGWSDLDFDSRRWAEGLGGEPDAYASGERSGDTRFVSASFGRILRSETITSQLYARVDARSISLDGFTETGAGISSLAWDAVDQESLTANLGASLRWWIEHRRFGVIRPSARIEWSHEFEDIGDQGVRYADWTASPTYLVPLDAWSRDSLRLDFGADWTLNDRLEFGVGYRGAFGDAGSSHGGEIRMKIGW
jgi:uncharacterized protein YhjY with autotransporter beta-barrel domain